MRSGWSKMPRMTRVQTSTARSVGDHIREWRKRRRLSQLDFALEAEISQKHLSFIESGRSSPSRDMVLRLAERLNVPLRDRNTLVLAAGYAPVFPERRIDDPALAPARSAIELILKGHEPFPALAVDRHWTMISANRAVLHLLELVEDKSMLEPPVNVLRLSLSPLGLARRIVNLAEWRAHILERLRQQVALTADAKLQALAVELGANQTTGDPGRTVASPHGGIALPLQLETPAGTLSFISTTTVFGTPVDITLSEIALETFFPADEATAHLLKTIV
jgi:transcriptional regulator with XRE-family HTH domain